MSAWRTGRPRCGQQILGRWVIRGKKQLTLLKVCSGGNLREITSNMFLVGTVFDLIEWCPLSEVEKLIKSAK